MACWRSTMVLAIALGTPAIVHAGPLDAMRDEVDDDDDDSGGGGGGGWSSDSDDVDDDDEGSSAGAEIGAAVVASIIEHNHAQGRPAFARYPYEIRSAASLPY